MDPYVSKKLDLLRFLAVCAVVVYHGYWSVPGVYYLAPPVAESASALVQGYVSHALMRWGLPCLSVVSGFLFFRNLKPSPSGFAGKMRTRLRTLVVPYLIWSGLGVLFALAVTHSPLRDVSPYWTISSLGEALDRWLVHPVIYPLWFMQSLMACVMLSPLVYLLVRALRGWAVLLAAAWWMLGWQPDALVPWVSATVFPAFITGATIALQGWKAPWARRPAEAAEHADQPAAEHAAAGPDPARDPRPATAPPWLAWLTIAAWLVAAGAYAVYGNTLGAWTRAGLLLVVVLGTLAVWMGIDALRGLLRPSARVVTAVLFVAPLSFFVYATQEPTLSILKNLTRRAEAVPIAAYLAAPLLTIALSVTAALILRRVAPRAYRLMTGGRGARRRRGESRSGTPAPAPQADAPPPAQAPATADAPAPAE